MDSSNTKPLPTYEGLPNTCGTCMNLFSSVDNLRALKSDEGLILSKNQAVDGCLDGCQICQFILSAYGYKAGVHFGRRTDVYHRLQKLFGHGDENYYFRGANTSIELRAVCEKGPISVRRGSEDYPYGILDIRNIQFGRPLEGFLSIFLDPGDIFANTSPDYLTGLPLHHPMDGDVNMNEAKRLIDVCLGTHKKCGGNKMSPLPRRVLDVDWQGPGDIKLYISPPNHSGRYTALSYCWGREPQYVTTNSNFEFMCQGFSSTLLSSSIQDAIKVTRKLGIKYLWVDALCIIQDNDEDKALQIDGMGTIYKNAIVTLAASNSYAAHRGFLKNTMSFKGCRLPFRLPGGLMTHIVIVTSQRRGGTYPLDSRAWTFQEQILSTRVLGFKDCLVSWTCQAKTGSLFSNPLPRSLGTVTADSVYLAARPIRKKNSKHHSGKGTQWAEILVAYSARKITKPEDRLPALAGISQMFQQIFPDRYLAGFWQGTLASHLSWATIEKDPPNDDDPPNEEDIHPADIYLGPTWSWVSIFGEIEFLHPESNEFEIKDCSVELHNSNSNFGRVRGGSLTILGTVNCIAQLKFRCRFDHRYDEIEYSHCIPVSDTDPVIIEGRLLFLNLNFSMGLVLVPARDGFFRRIGTFEDNSINVGMGGCSYNTKCWKEAERRLVTII